MLFRSERVQSAAKGRRQRGLAKAKRVDFEGPDEESRCAVQVSVAVKLGTLLQSRIDKTQAAAAANRAREGGQKGVGRRGAGQQQMQKKLSDGTRLGMGGEVDGERIWERTKMASRREWTGSCD